MTKERDRYLQLEKMYKKVQGEKETLDQKLKGYHEQLDEIESNLKAKVTEVDKITVVNGKLHKQVDELQGMLTKQRKQEQQEQVDQVTKIKDKDSEIEILKEMIKGIKVQLKCKQSVISSSLQPRTLTYNDCR